MNLRWAYIPLFNWTIVKLNILNILLSEKKAGNNNVFDEISAISDELRRAGVMSLRQLKNVYRNYNR